MSALVDRLLIGKYWPNNHDHMFFFGGAWKLFRIVLCPIWVAKFKGKEWLAQYSNFVRYSLSLASLVALSIVGMSWTTEGSSSSGNGFGVSFSFPLSFFFVKKDLLLYRCGNDKNYTVTWRGISRAYQKAWRRWYTKRLWLAQDCWQGSPSINLNWPKNPSASCAGTKSSPCQFHGTCRPVLTCFVAFLEPLLRPRQTDPALQSLVE